MNLLNYILNFRQGKEAHDFERESMEDPFLYKAIEGYDGVAEDQEKNIEKLRNRIYSGIHSKKEIHSAVVKPVKKESTQSVFNKRIPLRMWGILACFLLIIALFISLFLIENSNKTNTDKIVFSKPADTIINPIENTDSKTIDIPKKKPEKESSESNESSESKESKEPKQVSPAPPASPASSAPPASSASSDAYAKYIQSLSQKTASIDDDLQAISVKYARNSSKATSPTNKDLKISQAELDQLDAKISGRPFPSVGENAYQDYLKKNRKQLTSADCIQAKGKVVLLFSVNERGRPYNIKLLRSLCKEADKEAVRLLADGPVWTKGSKETRLEINF
ncbi:MAG: hypothetical protein LBT25_00635 [Candidatus Symbiothrix sp.]|jgi:outer membrane biosynthesis protein TonB|nr:hypothetical protein [Candidatus Symbiothrix sp.]